MGFTVTQGQLWNVGGRWKLGVRELLISLEIDILCLNQKWHHCQNLVVKIREETPIWTSKFCLPIPWEELCTGPEGHETEQQQSLTEGFALSWTNWEGPQHPQAEGAGRLGPPGSGEGGEPSVPRDIGMGVTFT